MKLLYKFIACTTLLSSSLFAQKLEVKYQELMVVDKDDFKKSMKFESSTSSKLPKDFEDQVYKSMTEPKDYILTIFDNESYYKKEEKISNNQSGGFSISFSTSGAGEGLYKNVTDKQYITNVSSFDKSYTIKDQLKNYDWKLSRETKKILGFDVKKATAKIDSTTTIIAWYAPALAVKNGPGKFDGLPGLILETESKNSKEEMNSSMVIRAVEVKEVPELKKIDKPKEKNVITDEEFKKITDAQSEKFKKMRSEGVDKKD